MASSPNNDGHSRREPIHGLKSFLLETNVEVEKVHSEVIATNNLLAIGSTDRSRNAAEIKQATTELRDNLADVLRKQDVTDRRIHAAITREGRAIRAEVRLATDALAQDFQNLRASVQEQDFQNLRASVQEQHALLLEELREARAAEERRSLRLESLLMELISSQHEEIFMTRAAVRSTHE